MGNLGRGGSRHRSIFRAQASHWTVCKRAISLSFGLLGFLFSKAFHSFLALLLFYVIHFLIILIIPFESVYTKKVRATI